MELKEKRLNQRPSYAGTHRDKGTAHVVNCALGVESFSLHHKTMYIWVQATNLLLVGIFHSSFGYMKYRCQKQFTTISRQGYTNKWFLLYHLDIHLPQLGLTHSTFSYIKYNISIFHPLPPPDIPRAVIMILGTALRITKAI